MKFSRILTVLILATTVFTACSLSVAQDAAAKPKPAPKSPPAVEVATIGGKSITINYSSPRVNGRAGKIFGKDGIIAKGDASTYPVWRAGANEATALKTDGELMIGDLKVPAGIYTLWVDISDPDQWVLVINKQTGQWGRTYDKTQDLGRVAMKMKKPETTIEELKYTITAEGKNKGELTLGWENHSGSVKFKIQ
jgi:hypothetical protein